MKTNFIRILALLPIVFSCKDEYKNESNVGIVERERERERERVEISLSEEGYLCFKDSLVFDQLYQEYIEGKPIKAKVKGLESVSDLNKRLEDLDTEDEMGSKDEYNMVRCSNMLNGDEFLMSILDTTMRLEIGDYFYKITEYGTFKTNVSNKSRVDSIISSYESIINKFTTTDSITYCYDDVFFAPSYAYSDDEYNYDEDEYESHANGLRYSLQDDITSYRISDKNIPLIGFCHKKTKKINSNRRMELRFHSTNFLFYTSSGIKLSIQKKKKIWFVTYWRECSEAKGRIIEFKNFEYKIKLKDPIPPSTRGAIVPSNYKGLSATIGNKTMGAIFTGLNKIPMLKDIEKSFLCWRLIDDHLTDDEARAIYKHSFEFFMGEIKRIGAKYISNYIYNTQKNNDNGFNFLQTREFDGRTIKHSLNGHKDYGAGGTKNIIFHRAAGITISSGSTFSIAPYMPENISFDHLNFTGMIFYNNQWYGINYHNGEQTMYM